jgi:hypothetical protein
VKSIFNFDVVQKETKIVFSYFAKKFFDERRFKGGKNTLKNKHDVEK